MKILYTIVLILTCLFVFGNPTRASYGARHVSYNPSEQMSYSASDYVQDGLVALWDGIENSGWGVHDPDAQSWTDLTGMFPYALNVSDMACTDTAFVNTSTNSTYVLLNVQNRSAPMREWWEGTGIAKYRDQNDYDLASDYTIEMAVTFHTKASYLSLANTHLIAFSSDTNKTGFNFSTPWNLPRLIFAPSVGWNQVGSGYSGKQVAKGSAVHASFSGRAVLAGGSTYKFNNVLVTTSAATAESASVTVRAYHYMNIRAMSEMEVHCIRIYNRALSDDEVGYNYFIDRERYGL